MPAIKATRRTLSQLWSFKKNPSLEDPELHSKFANLLILKLLNWERAGRVFRAEGRRHYSSPPKKSVGRLTHLSSPSCRSWAMTTSAGTAASAWPPSTPPLTPARPLGSSSWSPSSSWWSSSEPRLTSTTHPTSRARPRWPSDSPSPLATSLPWVQINCMLDIFLFPCRQSIIISQFQSLKIRKSTSLNDMHTLVRLEDFDSLELWFFLPGWHHAKSKWNC